MSFPPHRSIWEPYEPFAAETPFKALFGHEHVVTSGEVHPTSEGEAFVAAFDAVRDAKVVFFGIKGQAAFGWEGDIILQTRVDGRTEEFRFRRGQWGTIVNAMDGISGPEGEVGISGCPTGAVGAQGPARPRQQDFESYQRTVDLLGRRFDELWEQRRMLLTYPDMIAYQSERVRKIEERMEHLGQVAADLLYADEGGVD